MPDGLRQLLLERHYLKQFGSQFQLFRLLPPQLPSRERELRFGAGHAQRQAQQHAAGICDG